MRAYRKYLVIEDPKRITLCDVPFAAGERVEVVVFADEQPSAARFDTIQRLLKTTQALPQAHTLTDAEIAAEVAAVRAKR